MITIMLKIIMLSILILFIFYCLYNFIKEIIKENKRVRYILNSDNIEKFYKNEKKMRY